jgi:hypothetical protein
MRGEKGKVKQSSDCKLHNVCGGSIPIFPEKQLDIPADSGEEII